MMVAATAIFWPMGLLALVTFMVLGQIPRRRVAAVFKNQVTPDDFRFGESSNVSGHVALPNRAMMNLLELPMLFYVICLMAFVSGGVTWAMVVLAWGYVALRLAHSVVHMTYNRVTHRLIPYALSNVLLMTMWVIFFIGLWTR